MKHPADITLADHRPQAVLWDFDGTLVDTEPLWIGAEFEVVEQILGGTWSMAQAELLVGLDLIEAATRLLDWIGRSDLSPRWMVEQLLGRVLSAVKSNPDLAWRPGALDLLAALRAAGVPCALVSASYRVLLDAALSRLPAGSFTVSVGGDEVELGKPHPQPYLKAAALLGVEVANCIVLEDSPNGAQSGNAAGAVVIGVPHVVEMPPADRRIVVESLADLSPAKLADYYRLASQSGLEPTRV